MTELEKCREEIDAVDRRIVELYEKRMEIVSSVADYKIKTGKAVFDEKREREKIETLSALADSSFNRTAVREIFAQLMAISRKRQYQLLTESGARETGETYERVEKLPFKGAHVVFQGVEGAYSFEAMKTFFGDTIESMHVETWREAMQMVADGQADFGVLPIENSTAGSVSDIYDLLLQFPNYIVGEQVIRIEHMLMALPGAKLEDIDTVYSHPQGLAQCRQYLLENYPSWTQKNVLNTAMAAEKVAAEKKKNQAAIASRTAAEHFGLQILKEGGMSTEQNSTRFIILSGKPCFRKDAGKISLCFELPHACGTLYNILAHFIFNDLNLTKIESRPIPERPFEYRFFVDFEGNLEDTAVKNALRGIWAESRKMRILGNY